MPRYRTASEFRRQMVDLVRSGRTPEELAREFEPTAQSSFPGRSLNLSLRANVITYPAEERHPIDC